jgi:hypothetical protein
MQRIDNYLQISILCAFTIYFWGVSYFVHSKNFKIMAKQNTAAAEQTTPQQQDILILHNKVDKLLEVLASRDEEGKSKMVPYNEENRNTFLKIDKGASWVESFWKNLVSQFKDPTRFNLLSIQEAKLDDPTAKKALKDLAAGKDTKAVRDFLNKYEIRAKEPSHANDYGVDWEALAKQGITKEGLEKIGMLDDFLKKHAAQATGQPQNHRYSESLINWDEMKKMGISRDYLAQRNLLDPLLKGYKSNELVPLTIDAGQVRARIEARISLMNSPEGLKLLMFGVKQKPEFGRAFLGHVFSAEDKRNLLETGNMGRTVELRHRDGEYALSFVSLDRLTNDILAVKAEDVYVPKEIQNIQLSEHEMNELREGRAIKLDGLVASESGRNYDATIQINAERRGIEYIFESNKLFNAEKLGEVKLSQQQRDDLNAGKTILVENMVGKDSGALYDRYVKLDEGTGRPVFLQFNPDSPEDARQVIVPKELGGVRLTEEDRLTLREGRPVFVKDMTTRDGQERSSFVRVDMHTGRVQYSNDPNKFDERPRFEVPQELYGAKLTALQRAQLQDGKAVLVEGIKGYDGKVISQYAKVSRDQTRIDLTNDNPDRRQASSQRNANRQSHDNTQDRGRGI